MTADDTDAHLAAAQASETALIGQRRHEHLIAAQASRLEALRELTGDRPAHRAYVDALIAAPTGDARVRLDSPAGVSHRVEDALYDDVSWCLAEPPEQGYLYQYPNAYAALRRAGAVRAARAAETRRAQADRDGRYGGLGEALNIG